VRAMVPSLGIARVLALPRRAHLERWPDAFATPRGPRPAARLCAFVTSRYGLGNTSPPAHDRARAFAALGGCDQYTERVHRARSTCVTNPPGHRSKIEALACR